jgi:hypothetical protein
VARRIALATVFCAAATAVLTALGAGGTAATKQRIAIEERAVSDSPTGTFKLVPLTAGPIKADAGSAAFAVKRLGTVTTAGQRVSTYSVRQTLTGKRGVIEIRAVTKSTDAGGGYLAGAGPWSITAGTKAYGGLRGGGRQSGVLTPKKVIFTRYEGFVTVP